MLCSSPWQRCRPCLRCRVAAAALPSNKPSAGQARAAPKPVDAPRPERFKTEYNLHGDTRVDHYAWLRDPTRREARVLQHLAQENTHAKAVLQQPSLQALRDCLQGQVEGLTWRSVMAQMSLGSPPSGTLLGDSKYVNTEAQQLHYGSYRYSTVPSPGGKDRLMHLRHLSEPVSKQAASDMGGSDGSSAGTAGEEHLSRPQQQSQQLLLDEAARAAGKPHYHLHSFAPSPTYSHYAFTECLDTEAEGGLKRSTYTLHVHDAATGQPVMAPLHRAFGPVAWSPCGRQLHFMGGGGHELYTLDLPEQTAASTARLPHAPAAGARSGISATAAAAAAVAATGDPAPLASRMVFRDPGHFQLQFRVVHAAGSSTASGAGSVPGSSSTSFSHPTKTAQPGEHAQSSWLLVECIDSNLQAREVLVLLPPKGVAPGQAQGGAKEAQDPGGNAPPGPDSTATAGSLTVTGPGPWVWATLLPRSPGSRHLFSMCPWPRPGLVVWSWSVAQPEGCLQWVDLAGLCSSSSSTAIANMQSSDQGHAGEQQQQEDKGQMQQLPLCQAAHTLLQHSREWSIWDVQLRPASSSPQGLGYSKDTQAAGRSIAGAATLLVSWRRSPCTPVSAPGSDKSQEVAQPSSSAEPWVVGEAKARAQRAQQARSRETKICFAAYTLVPSTPHGNKKEATAETSGPTSRAPVALQPLCTGHHALEGLPFAQLQPPNWPPGEMLHSFSSRHRAEDGEEGAEEGAHGLCLRLGYSSLGLPMQTEPVLLWGSSYISNEEAASAASSCASAPPEAWLNRSSNNSCSHSSISKPLEGSSVVHVRLWAASADGTPVPISLAYDSSLVQPGSSPAPPLVLRVYGAYGQTEGVGFESARAALLSSGVLVAVAHVRGGGLLGPAWHEGGRGPLKAKGLEDLLACAQLLVDQGYTGAGRMALVADSAGGWLGGAALNAAPQLFRAGLLTVPSLDVLTTMAQDRDSLHELGDVLGDPHAYTAIKAWSPVDNVPAPKQLLAGWMQALATAAAAAKAGAGQAGAAGTKPAAAPSPLLFPHLLVRAGLDDTTVDFWEPAKYVAKLRHTLALTVASTAAAAQAGAGQTGASTNSSAAATGAAKRRLAAVVAAQPWALLQVRPGGHACYANTEEDAAACAFLLHCLGVELPQAGSS